MDGVFCRRKVTTIYNIICLISGTVLAFLYRAAVAGMRIADGLRDSLARHDALCRAAAHAQLAVEMNPEDQSAKWIRDEIRKRLEDESGLRD